MTDINKEIENLSQEIDNREGEIKMLNYYVFQPHEFVLWDKQADENWLFTCEEWSREDNFAKLKTWFFLSDYIRKLGFVSKQTTLTILEEILEKIEEIKAGNEKLKKENSEMKDKLLEVKAGNEKLKKENKTN